MGICLFAGNFCLILEFVLFSPPQKTQTLVEVLQNKLMRKKKFGNNSNFSVVVFSSAAAVF